MADIKTREVVKGTIKTLDKAAIVSDRMKSSYAKTKERAESAMNAEEGSPSEYAANRISRNAEMITREGGHQFNNIGQKAVEETKNNFIKTRQKLRSIAGIKRKGVSVNGADGTSLIKTGEKVAIKNASAVQKKVMVAKSQQTMAKQKVAKKSAEKSYQVAKATATATKKAVFVLGKAAKQIALGMKALISAIIAGGWVVVLIIIICCLFGAALYCFGGSGANYTPVSAEVEAYSETISRYADEYDIPEYTELIKAVMMQESEGKGNDPMNSGGKNPEESIKLGVQKIANLIERKGCESPLDMSNIREVLKEYNSGEDDDGYANSVLQYYPYGNFSDEILVLGNGVLGLPVQGMSKADITSHFGPRWGRMHTGTDFGYPVGTPIYASESGTVILAGWNGGYGKCVIIDHGKGMQTLYAHQSKIHVTKGMKVVRGQRIGETGNTGNSTGPHLHFEVIINGNKVDPMVFERALNEKLKMD